MKFDNSLPPKEKNLKRYYKTEGTHSFFLQYPKLVASGYLIDDPNWSSNVHMHDFSVYRRFRQNNDLSQ